MIIATHSRSIAFKSVIIYRELRERAGGKSDLENIGASLSAEDANTRAKSEKRARMELPSIGDIIDADCSILTLRTRRMNFPPSVVYVRAKRGRFLRRRFSLPQSRDSLPFFPVCCIIVLFSARELIYSRRFIFGVHHADARFAL